MLRWVKSFFSNVRKNIVAGIKNFFRDFSWENLCEVIGLFAVAAAFAVLIIAAAKVWFVWYFYYIFLEFLVSTFGLDLLLARAGAIFLAVSLLLALPSLLFYVLFSRHKKEVWIGATVIFILLSVSLYYGTQDVFFDRETGQPIKYYIKTTNGFKFSTTKNFDSYFGTPYEEVTPGIMQEIAEWQRTGEVQVPAIVPGKYFNDKTGKAIVWYAERFDGTVELFPLPGYDPFTGDYLKPMDKEIAQKIYLKQQEQEINASFVEQLDSRQIDEHLYLTTKNGFNVEKDVISLDSCEAYIEKIIYINQYTVVGIVFTGNQQGTCWLSPTNRIKLVDNHNGSHGLVRFIYDKNGYVTFGRYTEFIINGGEIKRVFLVFDYVPPDRLVESTLEIYHYTNKIMTIKSLTKAQ